MNHEPNIIQVDPLRNGRLFRRHGHGPPRVPEVPQLGGPMGGHGLRFADPRLPFGYSPHNLARHYRHPFPRVVQVGGPPEHQPQPQPEAKAPKEPSPPPLQRRRKPGLEISDLREENLTEAAARQKLSELVVVRMEKSIDPHEVDEVGKPTKPTWKRASRAEETDISQQEATRMLRDLDKKGPPVADKKAKLSTAVQRQLEKAQESLESNDGDERYEYLLVQLDSKVKKIDENSVLFKTHGPKKDKKGKKDKDAKPEPTKRERVSVTAIYRRIPKKTQDAVKMVKENKDRIAGKSDKPKVPPDGPKAGPAPVMSGGLPPPPPPAPGEPGKGNPNVQVLPEEGAEPGAVGEDGIIEDIMDPEQSVSGSIDSEEGSYSDDSEYITPESSLGTSSLGSRSRRGTYRYIERPMDRRESFGLDSPRRYMTDRREYPTMRQAMLPPTSPHVDHFAPTEESQDRLRQAYRDGQDDTAAVLTPLILQSTRAPGSRPRGSPRIVDDGEFDSPVYPFERVVIGGGPRRRFSRQDQDDYDRYERPRYPWQAGDGRGYM